MLLKGNLRVLMILKRQLGKVLDARVVLLGLDEHQGHLRAREGGETLVGGFRKVERTHIPHFSC